MITNMKPVELPDGERIPVLGQGTWGMGEKEKAHADQVAGSKQELRVL